MTALPPVQSPRPQGSSVSRIALIAGFTLVAIGTLVIAGYAAHMALLASLLPAWPPMKANAAIVIACIGGTILMDILRAGSGGVHGHHPPTSAFRTVRAVLPWLAIAISGVTLGEWIVSRSFGIDELIFSDMAGASGAGRMAPQTALGFLLASVALVSTAQPPTPFRIQAEGALTIPALFFGTLYLAAYLFAVPPGGGLGGYARLPFHTAVSLFVAGIGVIASRGSSSLFTVLSSATSGGRVARRMAPWVIAGPLVIGLLQLEGERATWYGTALGVALFATSSVIGFGVLAWWTAHSLDQADAERLRSTAELEVTEDRYRQLFDKSPVALYRTSPDGVILAANRALVKLLGCDHESEVVGTLASKFYVNPGDRDAFRIRIDVSSVIHDGLVQLRRRDGTQFWAEDTASLVRSADGRLAHYEGCLVDITARRQAEERVAASEKRLRSLIENSSDGLALLDRAGTVVYTSGAGSRILGWPAETRAGGGFADTIHVDDKPRARQTFQEALAAPNAVQTLEVRAQHADGSWRWVESTWTNLLNDPDVDAIVVNYRDVTPRRAAQQALRQSEERFRQMAEHITQAFFVVDLATNRALYISPTWADISGRPIDASEAPGARMEWVHPDDRDVLIESRARVARGETSLDTFRVVRPDGAIRWVRGRAYPVRDANGEVYRLVGVSEDITELREAEARFVEAQRMEAVGRLAGGVAHDFNNLLTVIVASAQMLRSELPPEGDAAELVSDIAKASDSAVGLTRQLLAFSRRQLVQPVVLDTNDAVASTAKMLRRLIGEDIALETRFDADAGAVRVDPSQFEQVLTNLAVNARDAMPAGGKLTIRTAVHTAASVGSGLHGTLPSGDYVAITVTDTGSGMAPEVLSRAFEPFFTTKERALGTGLGLATCEGIVRQAGGKIEVESAVGRGTTFTVVFPRVAADLAREPAFTPSAAHGTESVLLVEDEPGVRRVAARLLTSVGYKVIETRNAEEALRVLDTFDYTPNLLLTDVVLPGMGGRELAMAAKAKRPDIKVLYTSGYTDDIILQRALLARDVVVLQKPYTREQLAAKVREVLDG